MTDEVCKPSRVFESDEVLVHASTLGTLKASRIHPNLKMEIYVKQLDAMFSEFRFMALCRTPVYRIFTSVCRIFVWKNCDLVIK